MQWAGSHGHWTQSDFVGLPSVQRDADPLLQRWQVVAGGLALVLSRLSTSERSARYSSTYRLYQGLRIRLRQGAEVDAAPELLSDVMHEIAGVADVQTTLCLRACFNARLGRGDPADEAPVLSVGDSRPTSRLQSQPRPSQRSTLAPEWRDSSSTEFSEEQLAERANTLRSTLAAARGR